MQYKIKITEAVNAIVAPVGIERTNEKKYPKVADIIPNTDERRKIIFKLLLRYNAESAGNTKNEKIVSAPSALVVTARITASTVKNSRFIILTGYLYSLAVSGS